MPSLYNCRHDGDQYRITKFDSDWNVEASYLCDLSACECPAGHRPSCRHRSMLPKFIQRDHVGDCWFYDHDRGGWVQGASQELEEQLIASAALPLQQEPEPSQEQINKIIDEIEANTEADLKEWLAPAGLGQASGFDTEMQAALEADGEKLRQLTGEDHGPVFLAEEPSPSIPKPTIRRRV